MGTGDESRTLHLNKKHQMQKPDYSKISPELRAKLLELDKERPENQSLQVLQDIALMLQDILMTDDEKRKGSNKTIEEFGALLTDARESLQTIANKEDKEFPDFAKPITDLLDKLVETVNSKEYSPKIDVKVPDINVPTPQVAVDVDAPDLKGIEKLLKTEMPKAFEEAISKIPATVIPEYPDRWDEVLEWLESIDTASRKKPTFPTQLKVVNPDGSLIGGSGGLTDAELRATPVEVTGDMLETSFTTSTVGTSNVAVTDVSSYKSVSVHIVNRGTNATISFQGSNEGTNWVLVGLIQPSNTLSSVSTSTTAAGMYVGPLTFKHFRLNVTGQTAGTTNGVVCFFSHANPTVTTIAGQIAINGTQATNVAQIASTTTAVNTGTSSNGTQRVTMAVDTYSAVAVDASSSGNNTIVAITNTARLYYVSLSANGANSADVTAIVKIGTSEKFKVSLKAGSIFARNIGAGRRYLTGSSGDDIIVNLSDAQTVHVSVEYEDV